MSAYRKLRTQFTSRQHLRVALKAAGVLFEEVLPGQPDKHLVGYKGDERADTATFVVRREFISPSSNDLGYKWNPQTKCFEEIVSEYDTRCTATTNLRQAVKREYAVSTATTAARAKGYRVKRLDREDGTVQLQVIGRA